MAKKKAFTITENENKTVTFDVSGIKRTFADRSTLENFAVRMYERAQDQRYGMYRLVETPDGKVDIVFSNGDILHAKCYEDIMKLAEMIIADLQPGK